MKRVAASIALIVVLSSSLVGQATTRPRPARQAPPAASPIQRTRVDSAGRARDSVTPGPGVSMIVTAPPSAPGGGTNWIDFLIGLRWPLVAVIVAILLRRDLRLIWRSLVDRLLRAPSWPTPWGQLTSGEIRVPPALPGPLAVQPQVLELLVEQLLPMSVKILATLWHYQQKAEGPDFTMKRWEFRVSESLPEGHEFYRAASQLLFLGFVALDARNGMYFLTTAGIAYCRAHADQLAAHERFQFPND